MSDIEEKRALKRAAKEAERERSQQPIPPTTAVKAKKAHNIDTPRLTSRREHLLNMITNSNQFFEQKQSFAHKAVELHAIENVLEDRGEITDRRTTRSYTP